jgi:hypothetical protein
MENDAEMLLVLFGYGTLMFSFGQSISSLEHNHASLGTLLGACLGDCLCSLCVSRQAECVHSASWSVSPLAEQQHIYHLCLLSSEVHQETLQASPCSLVPSSVCHKFVISDYKATSIKLAK